MADIRQYKKIDKVGEGTYGVVYKAQHLETGRIVALKKIRLETEEEGIPSTSIREVSILKELQHPNIVQLLDVIMTPQKLYLVFEYVEMDVKRYIDHHLADDQYLSAKEIQSYSYQIIAALAFCHCRRIMHRDLKPQNLLIDLKGTIKLADFGLARAFGVPVRAYTHEVVTLWYRPPEVLLGTQRYSTALDMWSVATVIAEMATKRPLFCGDSEIDQLYRIFLVLGTPNSNIWPGVEELSDYNENFPIWRGEGLAEKMKKKMRNGEPTTLHHVNAAGIDLLGKMLIYDPLKRISSKAALTHEYFADLDPNQFECSKVPAVPMTRERRQLLQMAQRSDPLSEIPAYKVESQYNVHK